MCSDDMRLPTDWRMLQPNDVNILLVTARQVEIRAADPQNNQAMKRFRSQLTCFGEAWDTYRAARNAWENGTWHGGMGEPPNPLGWIWPQGYETGWESGPNDRGRGPGTISIFPFYVEPIFELVGDYTLLATIHDRVLPGCPRIDEDCLPRDLAETIWQDLLTGRDIESDSMGGRRCVIRPSWLQNALTRINEDLRPPRAESALQTDIGTPDAAKENHEQAGKPTAEPPPGQASKPAQAGSIAGMTWQAAKDKAEEYVSEHGFPGRKALAQQIGCDPRTLDKGINGSERLKAAEGIYKERKVPKPRAVTLTDKCLVKTESTRVEPSEEAAINEIASSVSRTEQIAKIKEWIPVVKEATGCGSSLTGDPTVAWSEYDDRTVTKIYLAVKQQVDETSTDNPKTPGRRKAL